MLAKGNLIAYYCVSIFSENYVMTKNLIHITLALIITAMGALQFLDHHTLWGSEELTLSSCENEEHSHPVQSATHICLLLRRHQLSAILNSEEIVHDIYRASQSVHVEHLILSDSYFASLFVERSPPA